MPLPVTNRRKSSEAMHSEKRRTSIRYDDTKNEVHDASSSAKKSEISVSTSAQRKSDADKSLHPDTLEKIAHKAPNDTYLYESTEFAGVTVTIRTANATKGYGNTDLSSKAVGRRKSEFQQPTAGLPQKFEPGDRSDQPGANASIAAAGKPEHSSADDHH